MRLLFVLFSFVSLLNGQDTIFLRNPSFEDVPHKGGELVGIREWFDCGRIFFPGETPPDIHSGDSTFWSNKTQPNHGLTYLGMVVRDNESWEYLSQRLQGKLLAGKCYDFSIHLMQSANYKSPTRSNNLVESDFLKPVVLRIWGGTSYCNQRILLAETETISNEEWKQYSFEFTPNLDVNYITLEAFYKTPTLFPYNGHILVDNASHIVQKQCPGEEIAYVDKPYVPPHKASRKNIKDSKPDVKSVPDPPATKNTSKKQVINKLDKSKLKEGQTIRIKKLFFEADTSSISKDSYQSLDEIYSFLVENPLIEIEIGGHTNGIPKHDYCDRLSTARAKEVTDYLTSKGIDRSRIKYKGYGKRKPIASNKTSSGRQLNQRVEIKILKMR